MNDKPLDLTTDGEGRAGDLQARVVIATLSLFALLILLLIGWVSIPIGCDTDGSARAETQARVPEPGSRADTLTVEPGMPDGLAGSGPDALPPNTFHVTDGDAGNVQAIFRNQILALAGDDRLDRDACIATLFEGFSAEEWRLLKRIEPPDEEARERVDSVDDPNLRVFEVRGGSDVPRIVDLLLQAGYVASPVYVYLPGPEWEFGPADAKQPVTAESAPALEPFETEPWSIAVVDFFGSDPSHAMYGHGPFIVSTVEQLSDAVPTIAEIDLHLYGTDVKYVADSLAVLTALNEAADLGYDIVNLSFGTYPVLPSQIPVELFHGISRILEKNGDVMITAAAGNSGHTKAEPKGWFYPAAMGLPEFAKAVKSDAQFASWWHAVQTGKTKQISAKEANRVLSANPQIYSVGATTAGTEFSADADDKAAFSNEAEVYAPGEHVVAYIDNVPYQWSGTSFAAPWFATCLAANLLTDDCRAGPQIQ